MVQRKYRLMFSPKQKSKPGPKGPTINLGFGTYINKNVVRRILAAHYRPRPGSDGPSWLTFLGIRRTAYGRSTYSVVNPWCYGRIGFSRDGSVHAERPLSRERTNSPWTGGALEIQARIVATDVTSLMFTGHWLMEQGPAETKAALKKFLDQ